MEYKFGTIFLLVLLSLISKTYSECSLIPPGINKPRNRNIEDRYVIEISGSPKTYTPNERYNVSLKVNSKSGTIKPFQNFILTLEAANESEIADRSLGQFDIIRGNEIITQFSRNCPNTVVGTNSFHLSEVQVYWTAPDKNSGCVVIKATVVESKENWFSDDGGLRKILCEDSSENYNIQPFPLPHCCACDEAKYEMAFEGLWTRNTHPRNFPSDVWSTRFSDIIGASHRKYQAFWQYEAYASAGLKELAEIGLTKTLESELKNNSENIRTIIKARGLHFPNITKSTYAVFRVDNKNHLVSLVSKIIPSPDWIVGVSDLELCKSDCTWEEERTLNLYPWDVGTDDGSGYTDSEPSTILRPIRRITPNNPNDPSSPFYNDRGEDMTPIARLHFIRQRVYEKPCGPDHYANFDDRDCSTTEWTNWSPCTSKCGKGHSFRTREHKNRDRAKNCPEVLTEVKPCFEWAGFCRQTNQKEGEEEEREEDITTITVDTETTDISTIAPEDERCSTGEWSPWSSCTSSCGKGTKTRDKKLKNPENQEICGGYEFLQENAECEENGSCENNMEADCPDITWGQWTVCNVTCGKGHKSRLRFPQNHAEDENEDDNEKCPFMQTVECEDVCKNEDKTEDTDRQPRSDNFIITQEPDGEVINCIVSQWSQWSNCKPYNEESKCGKGYKEKHRSILTHPENGGKECPSKLLRRQSCEINCKPSTSEERNADQMEEILENLNKKCIMGPWSNWTPCTSNCGSAVIQLRTRQILYQPHGVSCPQKVEQRRCRLPLICTDNKNRID